MIGAILQVTLPGFALGALVMALANRRVAPAVARARWLKLVVFGLIVHAVLGAAALGRAWVLGLLAAILLVGARELAGAWRRVAPPRPARIWGVFGIVALLGLWSAWRLPPAAFAFLFVVTATFDGFSQVVGQWLGRRKLVPRLSPGKTVEGLLGGLAAAAIVAVFVRGLLPAPAAWAAALGVAVGVTALAGDLAASWVKRRAGLKDYSALLPGQGGVLDRFDSLLGALALLGPMLVWHHAGAAVAVMDPDEPHDARVHVGHAEVSSCGPWAAMRTPRRCSSADRLSCVSLSCPRSPG